ncbi:phosphoglycolate phosphatase [Jannaschia rubra]|uniref:phosphoglycolate phosphatase n=1 Tax=Jannaschia rubra TaxID=282197 RepID=UPI0024916DC8|nr:phosphoglycolate phosphatase [Jannaschia rubra]
MTDSLDLSSVDTVVFDLDGTLIDSAPGIRDAVAVMTGKLDLPAPDLTTVIGFIGRGAPALVERVLHWAGADPSLRDRALAILLDIYDTAPLQGTTAYPGAQALLADLHGRGMRLGLCTNKPAGPARAVLDALGLGPFGAVAGGDSLPQRKPDAAPLLHVISELGSTADRTLYVGDSITDWQTAQAAGVRYVHVDGGYQQAPIPDFAPTLRLARLSDLATSLSAA